jgi:hypothetical protein
MCGHNSVGHFKVNTAASPPHKSQESYSNCSAEDSTGVQVSCVPAFGCHGYRDDLIQCRRFALWISEGFLFIFHLMYLPVAQTVWSGTVGWLPRNELTETWKAVMVA